MSNKLLSTKTPPNKLLTDNFGRTVRYLRISITDRCNLRCSYCRVGEEKFIPHLKIMRYEELMDLIDLSMELGIEKVRLTGGEPFARKGFMDFLAKIRHRYPQLDLRLTSNGTMLLPHIPKLKELKVAVNLSLDSFDPTNFAKITGRDLLPKVLESLAALISSKVPVKINAVALRGVNDHELPDFIDFALKNPVEVRFIEFMPMGQNTKWSQANFWPATEILAAAKLLTPLTPLTHTATLPLNQTNGLNLSNQNHWNNLNYPLNHAGPAQRYALTQGQGVLGLITPMSNHFCNTCNRLRITSDGYLRTCLFDDTEYRLANILRHPKLGLHFVQKILLQATQNKPLGTQIINKHRTIQRMTAIGG